jgi:DNA-binding MarR family transcriptional regulator
MATKPRSTRSPRPPRFDLARLLDDQSIGLEARVVEADHQSLKLWLRLLACSTQIEIEIRRRLRERFAVSLPRFDYLAQLHRHPEGLRMNALSRRLMVTGGSITGLTDQLEQEGYVAREPAADDRRATLLRLTASGRQAFEAMAAVHEAWIIELLGGLNATERSTLHGLLGRLRVTMPTENP